MSVLNSVVARLFPQPAATYVGAASDRGSLGEVIKSLAAVTPAAGGLPVSGALVGHAYTPVLNGGTSASTLLGLFSGSTQFVDVHSKIGAHAGVGIKPYAPGFQTQGDAADYIASQMGTSHNGPAVDQKVRNAVRDACTEWQPGQNLAKLVYDKVLAALKGVLPETKAPTGLPIPVPGGLGDIFKNLDNQLPDGVNLNLPPALGGGQPRFDFPNSAQAVAYLAAKQIQANGATVADVAEHLLNAPSSAPR